MRPLLFENETCTRCGGSGKYSFCERFRDVCFKCHGAKVTLTKRGAAAQAYFTALQTVALSNLKVGQIIECSKISNGNGLYYYKAPVVSVELSDSVSYVSSFTNGIQNATVEYIHVKTEHAKYGMGGMLIPKNGTVRVWPNSPENIAMALAYQGTLTKSGTVYKKRNAKGR